MLRRILPHIAIVLSNMYIVFYCIDRVNSAMSFIDNGITKALLLVLSALSIINACFLIRDERGRMRRAQRRERPRVPTDDFTRPAVRRPPDSMRGEYRASRFGGGR